MYINNVENKCWLVLSHCRSLVLHSHRANFSKFMLFLNFDKYCVNENNGDTKYCKHINWTDAVVVVTLFSFSISIYHHTHNIHTIWIKIKQFIYTKIHFSKSENRNARVCVYMCVLFGAFGVSNKFTHMYAYVLRIFIVFFMIYYNANSLIISIIIISSFFKLLLNI